MAKYDLTNSLETSFDFTIGDKEFLFVKPKMREMREIRKKFAGIDKEKDLDKQIELSDEAMAELYEYVQSINHDVPIQEVLADHPSDVQAAFNDMLKTELVG